MQFHFRAALGGSVCAPYCKNMPFLPFKVQLENAEDIMDSKKDLICPELCGIQLGKWPHRNSNNTYIHMYLSRLKNMK